MFMFDRLCGDAPPNVYYNFQFPIPILNVYVSQEVATKIATALTTLSEKTQEASMHRRDVSSSINSW